MRLRTVIGFSRSWPRISQRSAPLRGSASNSSVVIRGASTIADIIISLVSTLRYHMCFECTKTRARFPHSLLLPSAHRLAVPDGIDALQLQGRYGLRLHIDDLDAVVVRVGNVLFARSDAQAAGF